jgi:hypothetical protein
MGNEGILTRFTPPPSGGQAASVAIFLKLSKDDMHDVMASRALGSEVPAKRIAIARHALDLQWMLSRLKT